MLFYCIFARFLSEPMTKFDYKRAAEEIAQINAIVETCPEAVKEKCFELLFAAVFNTTPAAARPVEGTEAQGATQEESTEAQGATQEESTEAQGATQEESTEAQGVTQEESTEAQGVTQEESTEAQGATQEEKPEEQEKDLPPPDTTIVIPPLPTVPERNAPTLTDEAKELLLEAAKSRDGTLMHVKFIDGVAITTNGKQFAQADNPRSAAAWEGALHELETHNLIQPLGPKREVYQVTREGYRMAEFLRA
jgi:hypothetical protein